MSEAPGDGILDVCAMMGAAGAGEALSKLLDREIVMGDTSARIASPAEIQDALGGPDSEVAMVMMEMTGDVEGEILLVFPIESAAVVVSRTSRQNFDAYGENTELAMSSLEETGNILLSSFTGALSDISGLEIELSPPCISVGPCGATLDYVIISHERHGGKCLNINTGFFDLDNFVTGHIFLLADPEQLAKFTSSNAGGGA